MAVEITAAAMDRAQQYLDEQAEKKGERLAQLEVEFEEHKGSEKGKEVLAEIAEAMETLGHTRIDSRAAKDQSLQVAAVSATEEAERIVRVLLTTNKHERLGEMAGLMADLLGEAYLVGFHCGVEALWQAEHNSEEE